MGRPRRDWYILGLVLLLVIAAVVVGLVLRPARTIAGSPSVAGDGASTGPSIPPPPDGSTTPPSPPPTSSEPDGSTTPPSPPPASDEPDGAIGAETAGDPYYPDSGNGGYDVGAYQVDLTFDPEDGQLAARTTITAEVTGDTKLGRFSFDLQPTMKVSAVAVDGGPAGFSQHDAKLVVTPAAGVAAGVSVTVVVTYAGSPTTIVDGVSGLADGGWYPTSGGGAAVLGEPFSASAWYPVNEHPTDRAMFGVTAQVPTGWKVISNGLPVADLPAAPAGYTSFGWSEKSEMASYLSTLYIEKFTMTQDTTSSGLPIINAYGPGAEQNQQFGDNTGEYLDFLATKFGPYPFDSSGGIFTADSFGFALETQTRPIYSGFSDEPTVVHELAHQWFGDAVTVQQWSDICLNECFASYAEWLWSEKNGADLDDKYRQLIQTRQDQTSFWRTPLVDMGAGNEFGVVYSRGPIALHALRAQLGDEKFSELQLSWIEEHSGESASWSEFEDLVSQISGKDEAGFLEAWFRKTSVPADAYLWPGDLHP